MRYTITFKTDDYKKLYDHLMSMSEEQAAYLLCGISRSSREIRFLVREVIPVPSDILLKQGKDFITIPSTSYVPVLKKSSKTGQCFFLVHSHQNRFSVFSPVDDNEEPRIIKPAYVWNEKGIHGSLVITRNNGLSARVWLENGKSLVEEPISLIRIVGQRYEFIVPNNATALPSHMPEQFFDRQVRAFGKDLQQLLGNLHVGVVGAGGTGSAVIEQLARLGVGELTILDDDKIDGTNITRIHGSAMEDFKNGKYKVDVMEAMIDNIGFGTKVDSIPKNIMYRSAAEKLKDCDLILGCTDDHFGRMLLNQISLKYYIPLIDMGVFINSDHGKIRNIDGRVSIVIPGNPCLLCTNCINQEKLKAEIEKMCDPELYKKRVKEGYCPELDIEDPSVITFTTSIASQAIIELIHLITGFMGSDEDAARILFIYDYRKFIKKLPPKPSTCICDDPNALGCGDQEPFLGLTWPTEV